MQKVVLDTNVLLVSISSKSRLHWVFSNLLHGKYILCVTTDILAEYAESILLDILQKGVNRAGVPTIVGNTCVEK